MEKQNLDCKDKTAQQLNKSLSSQTYCHPLQVASSGFNSHNYARNLSIKIVLDSPRLKSSLHTCFLIELDKLVYDWKRNIFLRVLSDHLKKIKKSCSRAPRDFSQPKANKFLIHYHNLFRHSSLSTIDRKNTSVPLISACLEVGFSSKAYGLGA